MSAHEETRLRRRREVRFLTEQKIFIGIILDGVNKFKNLSSNNETKKYGRLTVITTPTFGESAEKEVIDFHPGEAINIKVCIGLF